MNADLELLDHILEAGRRVQQYTQTGRVACQNKSMTIDAVEWNVEIIGEASDKRRGDEMKWFDGLSVMNKLLLSFAVVIVYRLRLFRHAFAAQAANFISLS